MNLPDPAALTAILGAAVGALGWAIHKAWPFVRRFVGVINDFAGEEARPGVERRPGLMERMARQEQADVEKTRKIDELTVQMSRVRADQVAMASDMAEVKKEVTTNGGSSLKDAVGKLREQVNEVLKQIPTQTIRVD